MTWNELLELLHQSIEVDVIDHKRKEISEWIPYVCKMFDYDQNSKYHQYDLWLHSLHTVIEIDKSISDDMVYLAALLHDIGKPLCRIDGLKGDNTYSHYYGHPQKGEHFVKEQIIPQLISKGATLTENEIQRLLYYIRYHDDRISLREDCLKRHLSMVDLRTFKNLMALHIADAKAHIIYPVVQKRIDICSEWLYEKADKLFSTL